MFLLMLSTANQSAWRERSARAGESSCDSRSFGNHLFFVAASRRVVALVEDTSGAQAAIIVASPGATNASVALAAVVSREAAPRPPLAPVAPVVPVAAVAARASRVLTASSLVASLGLGFSWPEVEVGCELRVDLGRRLAQISTRDRGDFDVFGAAVGTAPSVKAPEGAPALCEYAPPAAPGRRRVDASAPRRAVLTIATDFAYLRAWELYLWNKVCYCSQHGLSVLLFVGTIPTGHAPSEACSTGKASDHWIKALAIATALEHGVADELLVLDTDAIFTRAAFGERGGLLGKARRRLDSPYARDYLGFYSFGF